MSVTEVRECARGCVVSVGIEDAQDIPAIAEAGAVLCVRCLARLRWRLGDIADVAARARLALIPGQAASGSGERVSGSRMPDLPFNVVAFETCDALVNLLGGWCVFWGSELRVEVPRQLEGAAGSSRDLAGVKAGTDADAVAVVLEEWNWWIRRHWDAIVAREAAIAFYEDIAKGVRVALNRFPRDEERVVVQKPRYCPVCELKAVRVTWTHGRDPVVACTGCRWVFETEWRDLLEQIGI